jgi:hypothetical protein
MKLKISTIVQTEVEMDLMAIAAVDWPVEVKSCAYTILGRYHKEYLNLPEIERKAWLVAKIEKWMSLDIDDL